MKNVRWRSYGGEPAVGEGVWNGRRETFQLTTIAECRGVRAYRYIQASGGKAPPFPISDC
jgi:hypothetical protein